ncbi:MAG: hypothetical protein WA817_13050 [Candidatus Acidiferrum sp.]
MDRMCGKLVSMEAVREKGKTSSSIFVAKPVSHARVRLFPPTASGDCCTLMTPSAEVLTARDGEFEFKKIEAGDYWLAAVIAGKEYKLLVRYEPSKKPEKSCSDSQYTLQEGKFQFIRTATGHGRLSMNPRGVKWRCLRVHLITGLSMIRASPQFVIPSVARNLLLISCKMKQPKNTEAGCLNAQT